MWLESYTWVGSVWPVAISIAVILRRAFIADPFTEGERLYRTGDLVRWREMASSVPGAPRPSSKNTGLRIELGEIEAELLSQPEVREAVVVAQEGSSGSSWSLMWFPRLTSSSTLAHYVRRWGNDCRTIWCRAL